MIIIRVPQGFLRPKRGNSFEHPGLFFQAFPSESRQVFSNVIKNTIQATADGGQISIYSEAAHLSGQSGVLVRVVDNGVGIPKQLQSKLFRPLSAPKMMTAGDWVFG